MEVDGWTQEDIDIYYHMKDNMTLVYDFVGGLSPDLNSIVWDLKDCVYRKGEQWATASEEYYGLFQAGVDSINAAM